MSVNLSRAVSARSLVWAECSPDRADGGSSQCRDIYGPGDYECIENVCAQVRYIEAIETDSESSKSKGESEGETIYAIDWSALRVRHESNEEEPTWFVRWPVSRLSKPNSLFLFVKITMTKPTGTAVNIRFDSWADAEASEVADHIRGPTFNITCTSHETKEEPPKIKTLFQPGQERPYREERKMINSIFRDALYGDVDIEWDPDTNVDRIPIKTIEKIFIDIIYYVMLTDYFTESMEYAGGTLPDALVGAGFNDSDIAHESLEEVKTRLEHCKNLLYENYADANETFE